MTSHAECRSHAALCKQFARQEPINRFVWSAEAEYWLRLSKERLRGEARTKKLGCLSNPRRQTTNNIAGEANARAHAALRPVTGLVQLTGFVVSVRSLIFKWLRPIWFVDASAVPIVVPQRTKNQAAKVKTAKSARFLVELG